jgi:DNA-binding transcriptional MerR regulator
MRITRVAGELGVSSAWIKRLERDGLIPRIPRDPNGHRRFAPEDVERLRELIFGRRVIAS